jgi:hypothetical protein
MMSALLIANRLLVRAPPHLAQQISPNITHYLDRERGSPLAIDADDVARLEP